MSRKTDEWRGKTDDTRPPPRIYLRVFLKFDGRCQCGCNRLIRPTEQWQLDHTIALINGGKNRESNLRPLLTEHHAAKTRADVAEKAMAYRKQVKHLGIKRKSSRPMAGSKASGFRKRMNGTVERRT